jgi:molybdopterin molybdotransferase
MSPTVGWHRARELAFEVVTPLQAHRVSLQHAAGLVSAEDLVARSPMPAFDTSAMDGYAVAGPPPWTLRGHVLAGRHRGARLSPGEGVGISTGAQVPDGADTVVPLENAHLDGGIVRPRETGRVSPGRHIRRAGEDARAGEVLVPAGTRVGAAMVGLAAMAGYDELCVRPRPTVVVMVTGDELTATGMSGAGRVRDALGPMLPPLVSDLGGSVVDVMRVSDAPGRLAAAVARRGTAEIVLVTGSTSAGVSDRLRPHLRELGARMVVDGVACRPGHPQLLAELGHGRWLIGMPGNPFAAFVTAHTLLAPMLAGLVGRPLPALQPATLEGLVRRSADRTVLVPAVHAAGGVRVVPGHRSADLRGIAQADVLAVVEPATTPESGISALPLTDNA